MRHPCYRQRHRPRSSFIRPRCLRSRAVLVELVLLAILIDPRNDSMPQTGTRRKQLTGPSSVCAAVDGSTSKKFNCVFVQMRRCAASEQEAARASTRESVKRVREFMTRCQSEA